MYSSVQCPALSPEAHLSLVAKHPDALPAGRPITRLDVVASQRGRLLDAATRVIAAKGYPAATVADIVREAGVSRGSFYEHFEGKEHCFRVGFKLGYEVVQRAIDQAFEASEGDWLDRGRAGVATFLSTLAQDPAFCRAYVLEPLAAGPELGALWEEVLSGFAAMVQRGLRSARYGGEAFPQPPDENFLAMVGGVHALVARHIRRDNVSELPSLEPVLLHFILSVFLGPARADEALQSGPLVVPSEADGTN
jgi:AcrR family transcriptional regulator